MKNRLIKLLSFILAVVCIPVNYIHAEENIIQYEDITKEESYRVLDAIGILPESVKEKALTNSVLTRAEFTGIIYNIATFNVDMGVEAEGWENEFFGEYQMEETADVRAQNSTFSDVDSSMEFGKEISYVCGMGLMQGKGGGIFAPDKNISYMEEAKTIIGMLGYSEYVNSYGGYIEGIHSVLADIDIYYPGDKAEMTVLDTCKLLYSAFEEEVMVFKFENGDMNYLPSKENFMNKWLELDKIKGVVTDNGITSLDGDSQIDIGKIKVDDKVFKRVGENDFSHMIGKEVFAFYSFNDDKENELFACVETQRNKITEISVYDISKYKDYVIEYNNGTKIKNLKLDENTYMIYNGKAKTSWNSGDFNFADGTVTVIDNQNGYNVVIIEDYMNVLVSSYDAENMRIYNKAKDNVANNGDEVIDIKEAYEEGITNISWYTGEKATVEDIKSGIVIDLVKNDNYVKMVLTDNVVNNFKVTSIGAKNEYEHYFEIKSGEESYNVLKRYNDAKSAVTIDMNNTYSLYLNRNGMAVWVDSGFLKSESVAYVIKTYMEETEESLCIKMLNENGKVVSFNTASKVKYTDNLGESYLIDANALYVRMRDYKGIISYKMNAEEKITAVIIPREKETTDEALQEMKYNSSGSLTYQSDTGYGHFQGEVFISDTTKIFVIPTTEADKGVDSNYKVGTRSTVLKSSQKYPQFKAYKYNKNSHVAQFLVMETNTNAEFSYNSASLQFMLVNEISYGLDYEDEMCMIVSGWQLGYNVKTNDYITKYAKINKTDSSGKEVSALEIATDLLNSQNERGELNKYKVQKGDIVRFCTDETGESITSVQILYGMDRVNPAFPEGRKGWLVGTSGKYSPDSAYSNPFSVTNNGSNIGKVNKIAELSKHMGGGTRFYAGFVYDYVDGIVELTTNDFTVNTAYTGDELAHFAHPRIFKTSTVINRTGNDYTVTSGGDTYIKTYKDFGGECSKMITVDLDNTFRFYIIINEN